MTIVDNLMFTIFLISPIFITGGILFTIENIKDKKEKRKYFKNSIDK